MICFFASRPITDWKSRTIMGKGMGAEDRAEHVMRVRHVRDPVAHGLVDGVLQRLAAEIDGPHDRSEELHAEDVQRLARHVVGAHVDLAVEAEHGGGRGRCNAVLSRAGLGDHAGLAHALCKQDLGQGVVDLVSAGVAEVLALEIDLRAAEMVGQPLCEIERRGPADEFPGVVFELGLELLVLLRRKIGGLELGQRGHQRLGSELPAVDAEVSFFIRNAHGRDALRTSVMNFLIFAWSLIPFSFSTPPATSTP